jgi:hypothetical protein
VNSTSSLVVWLSSTTVDPLSPTSCQPHREHNRHQHPHQTMMMTNELERGSHLESLGDDAAHLRVAARGHGGNIAATPTHVSTPPTSSSSSHPRTHKRSLLLSTGLAMSLMESVRYLAVAVMPRRRATGLAPAVT